MTKKNYHWQYAALPTLYRRPSYVHHEATEALRREGGEVAVKEEKVEQKRKGTKKMDLQKIINKAEESWRKECSVNDRKKSVGKDSSNHSSSICDDETEICLKASKSISSLKMLSVSCPARLNNLESISSGMSNRKTLTLSSRRPSEADMTKNGQDNGTKFYKKLPPNVSSSDKLVSKQYNQRKRSKSQASSIVNLSELEDKRELDFTATEARRVKNKLKLLLSNDDACLSESENVMAMERRLGLRNNANDRNYERKLNLFDYYDQISKTRSTYSLHSFLRNNNDKYQTNLPRDFSFRNTDQSTKSFEKRKGDDKASESTNFCKVNQDRNLRRKSMCDANVRKKENRPSRFNNSKTLTKFERSKPKLINDLKQNMTVENSINETDNKLILKKSIPNKIDDNYCSNKIARSVKESKEDDSGIRLAREVLNNLNNSTYLNSKDMSSKNPVHIYVPV